MKKELREEIKRSEALAEGSEFTPENPGFPVRNILIGTAIAGGIGIAGYFLYKTLSDEDKKQKAMSFFKNLGQRQPFRQAKEKVESFSGSEV
jgi:hypothetical protein